jgi:hypothetical protein
MNVSYVRYYRVGKGGMHLRVDARKTVAALTLAEAPLYRAICVTETLAEEGAPPKHLSCDMLVSERFLAVEGVLTPAKQLPKPVAAAFSAARKDKWS